MCDRTPQSHVVCHFLFPKRDKPPRGRIGLLTVKELAKVLSVHEKTVRRYARTGKIPAIKTKRGYRFVLKAVLNTLQVKSNVPLQQR